MVFSLYGCKVVVNPFATGAIFKVFRSAWRNNFIGSNERYMYVVSSCQRVLKDLFANWF